MTERRTLADQWSQFVRKVGLTNMHAIQRKEMRRAFYAGAASLLDAMMTGLDEDREPTADDLAYLDRISDELEKFGLDIAAGKA